MLQKTSLVTARRGRHRQCHRYRIWCQESPLSQSCQCQKWSCTGQCHSRYGRWRHQCYQREVLTWSQCWMEPVPWVQWVPHSLKQMVWCGWKVEIIFHQHLHQTVHRQRTQENCQGAQSRLCQGWSSRPSQVGCSASWLQGFTRPPG